MRSFAAWMMLPSATAEIVCISDFQSGMTSSLGGRDYSDTLLGAWDDGYGAWVVCKNSHGDDSTCELQGPKLGCGGSTLGWGFATLRYQFEEMNGKNLDIHRFEGNRDIQATTSICGSGHGHDPWQFGDAVVVENRLGGTDATVTFMSFLNADRKRSLMGEKAQYSMQPMSTICDFEVVVQIPVNPEGDTTFSVSIRYELAADMSLEDLVNDNLRVAISQHEYIEISSRELEAAITVPADTSLRLPTGFICASTMEKVQGDDVVIWNDEARMFYFKVSKDAVSHCDFIYWSGTSDFRGPGDSGAQSSSKNDEEDEDDEDDEGADNVDSEAGVAMGPVVVLSIVGLVLIPAGIWFMRRRLAKQDPPQAAEASAVANEPKEVPEATVVAVPAEPEVQNGTPCPSCRTRNHEGDRFCQSCGKELHAAAPPTEAASAPDAAPAAISAAVPAAVEAAAGLDSCPPPTEAVPGPAGVQTSKSQL